MALTMAHHDGRVAFDWDDLVEALTTLDAGTAVGSEHVGVERRSVAIHEAGHAVAGHLYVESAESARLTIKKRGETGGHHWMIQKEDRMFAFQHEMFARRRAHARGDGRRARLLRREHERRRR